jgi:hypothetical protein
MPDQLRPPPLPTFPPANDISTEPGLGLLAMKLENARLRRERDEARALLPEETESEDDPPPTRKQRLVRGSVRTVGGALAVALVGLVSSVVEHRWPAFASLVHGIIGNLGMQ